jgi:hypothetical protein
MLILLISKHSLSSCCLIKDRNDNWSETFSTITYHIELSYKGLEVRMLEIFWQNAFWKLFNLFDNDRRAIIAPPTTVYIFWSIKDLICFSQKSWNSSHNLSYSSDNNESWIYIVYSCIFEATSRTKNISNVAAKWILNIILNIESIEFAFIFFLSLCDFELLHLYFVQQSKSRKWV